MGISPCRARLSTIATASSADKRQLALDLGADVAVDANAENMTDALREANNGQRVDVVLDMTGGRITNESVAALAPFGRLAFYGMANRQPPNPVQPASLMSHLTTVAGLWLVHAMRVPGLMVGLLDELFGLVAAGQLRAVPGGEYGLAEVRRAHEDLRARRSVYGSSLRSRAERRSGSSRSRFASSFPARTRKAKSRSRHA